MNRSRASTSQANHNATPFIPLINECVKYILCREGSKIPIKEVDIKQHLQKIGLDSGELRNIVPDKVNGVLKNVYGYKLVLLNGKERKYIVVLDEPCTNPCLSSYINPQHRRVLIASLLHIYMSAEPVKEDDLLNFIHNTGLCEENDKKTTILLKNFTQQLYLKYSKVEETGQYEWGQRAEHEVPKMFLLNKMAKAFKVEPRYWMEQYRKAAAEQTIVIE